MVYRKSSEQDHHGTWGDRLGWPAWLQAEAERRRDVLAGELHFSVAEAERRAYNQLRRFAERAA